MILNDNVLNVDKFFVLNNNSDSKIFLSTLTLTLCTLLLTLFLLTNRWK